MKNSEKEVLRLQSIIDGSNLGTWEWNVQTGEVILNERWAQIIGYTLKELSPINIKTWEALTHPDDLVKSGELLKRHFNGELPQYKIECRMKHKEGHWVWVRDQGKVFSWTDNGKPLILLGSHIDITNQKNLEENLIKGEEKHNTILSNISDVIGIIGSDGIMKYKSPNIEKWFGWKPKDLVGSDSWLTVHPDDLERIQKGFYAILEKDKATIMVEYRYKCKNGNYKWIELTATNLTNDPVIGGVLLNYHDITERKQAEESLQEAEWNFKALFEKGPIGVAYHVMVNDDFGNPIDYRFLDANEAYMELTGVDTRGQLVTEAFPGIENDPFDWIGTFGKVARTGESIRFEQYLEANQRWYDCVGYQYKPDHFVAAFLEITKRKKAEEVLAAQKEQLAVTLRSIGDGVITTDIKGNIVIMNKVAEELCGWNQNEAQGKPLTLVFNIINQSTREQHENPVEKVLTTGKIIELENHTLLISRDGTERIIADSGAPIKDKDSNTIGVVLVFRDMTEKHRMLDNLQRMDKLESIGVLAGGIAHDFNNLLGGVFGYIELARENSTSDKTVSKYLDKAFAVFDRAKDLTQQLLTFSKGGTPKRKTGQICKLIEDNASFVLSGSDVNCNYQIDPNIWLADYDENQIGQVIDNLVLNAQQAMPIGGTIVMSVHNITLKENEDLILGSGNYIKISITDTGSGITQDIMKRIFDPFFTTKQKGNGLGLATCYSIIQKHDGYIDVESIPGKGTTFHVYLPASKESTVEDLLPSTSQHKGKGSILVLDDEDFIRETVGETLEAMGYTLIEAKNGEEALHLCSEAKKQGQIIRGALFDLTIPGGMGGKEAIIKLRKEFPYMPVFASSGFSEDPIMARPTEFGFTDSIRKPYKKSELVDILNKHLQG